MSSETPLPSDDPSPPSTVGPYRSDDGTTRAPPRRRIWLTIAVVGVVVILVLGVVAFIFIPTTSPAATVTVTSIAFTSPDDACGVAGATSQGFNVSTDESLKIGVYMYGNSTATGTSACTIQAISTTTPGFSITGADVPLVIPANEHATLSFTVNMPGSAFSGVLTLVVT
jgi:hypothetical protein